MNLTATEVELRKKDIIQRYSKVTAIGMEYLCMYGNSCLNTKLAVEYIVYGKGIAEDCFIHPSRIIANIKTKCIKKCLLDETKKFCLGCGRTLEEIKLKGKKNG